MPKTKSRKKKPHEACVGLGPDLEQAKTAVLNSLTSASGQRTYDHAISEFVAWYCSEPRLAFQPDRGSPVAFTWSSVTTRRRQSIYGWPPSAVSRMRRLMLALAS